MRARTLLFAARVVVWSIALIPLLLLVWYATTGDLGPDPGKRLVDQLGIWALRLLLVTLAVRPLAELMRQPVIVRLRRLAGLWALAYALFHFAAALLYVLGWRPEELMAAIAERQYVLLGFAALVLLIPLGLTSTRRAQARLGRRWRTLHRLIFPAAVLALCHFIWLVRSDYGEPLIYLIVLSALLGYRGSAQLGRLIAQRGR